MQRSCKASPQKPRRVTSKRGANQKIQPIKQDIREEELPVEELFVNQLKSDNNPIEVTEELPVEELFVNQLKSDNNPIEVTVYINNKPVQMEIVQEHPYHLYHIPMNHLPITRKDPVLSRVYRYVQHGWPENVPVELKLFSTCKSELSSLGGCLLRGSRVVIPPLGRY